MIWKTARMSTFSRKHTGNADSYENNSNIANNKNYFVKRNHINSDNPLNIPTPNNRNHGNDNLYHYEAASNLKHCDSGKLFFYIFRNPKCL